MDFPLKWLDLGGRGDNPVVHASHVEALAYCAWTGTRLLTETEWEYAASGTPGFGSLLTSSRLPSDVRAERLRQHLLTHHHERERHAPLPPNQGRSYQRRTLPLAAIRGRHRILILASVNRT